MLVHRVRTWGKAVGKLKNNDAFPEDEFSEEYFELEITDLPLDDEDAAPGAFAKQSLLLFARLHSLESSLAVQRVRLLALTRAWLLTDVSRTRVKEQSEASEFELEITELPAETSTSTNLPPLTGLSGRLAPWSSRGISFAPRLRLWRLTLAACTVMLVFLLTMSSIPSARDWAYNLLVRPTTTPVGIGNIPLPGLRNLLIKPGTRWSVILPGASTGPQVASNQSSQIVIQSTTLAPGPVPLGNACQANPVVDNSQTVGNFPVLVKGFDGPLATIHMGDVAVVTPNFPGSIGWAVTLQVNINPNYTGFVTLTGSNQFDGSTLLFGFPGRTSQETTITLGSQRYAAPLDPTVTIGTGKAHWEILMFVPTAGCYYLNAAWAGGRWSINFAAGE